VSELCLNGAFFEPTQVRKFIRKIIFVCQSGTTDAPEVCCEHLQLFQASEILFKPEPDFSYPAIWMYFVDRIEVSHKKS
jgi:hypothetical protein